jgi:hypothetical protein
MKRNCLASAAAWYTAQVGATCQSSGKQPLCTVSRCLDRHRTEGRSRPLPCRQNASNNTPQPGNRPNQERREKPLNAAALPPKGRISNHPNQEVFDKVSNAVAPQQARENNQTRKETKKTIERSSPAVSNYPQPRRHQRRRIRSKGKPSNNGKASNNEPQTNLPN